MFLHGALNHFMLGTTQILGSSMLEQDDPNFTSGSGSYLFVDTVNSNDIVRKVKESNLDAFLFTRWMIPNMLYSPEAIFSNQIGSLDVNFINSHEYTAVEYESGSTTNYTEESTERQMSAAGKLSETIASWYRAFRNIAIVGLLSVLVYIGIRILIGSTAPDKAKYKERLQDWLVALCLVFIVHFIMSAVLLVTEQVTKLFAKEPNNIVVQILDDDDNVKNIGDSQGFRTNLIGYARFMTQSSEWSDVVAYTIIYLALIIYTVMFTFTYFKRFLFMAFFTMISPLVALTYPIDKLGDGKAQAFNYWFKEYTMNAIIQPVHLILYTVFVGSAMDLAVDNPIYAIVAIGALIPAEKIVKKMFGLDRSETTSGLGALAGGALTMQGINAVRARLSGGKGGSSKGGNSDGNSNEATLPSRDKSPRYNSNPLGTIFSGATLPTGEQDTQDRTVRQEDNNEEETQQPDTQQPETVDEEIARRRRQELQDLETQYQNNPILAGMSAGTSEQARYIRSAEWEDKTRAEIEERREQEQARQEAQERERMQQETSEPTRTRWDRFKGGMGAIADQKRRQLKNVPRKIGQGAVNGVKNGVKFVGRSIPKVATGAALGAMAGVVATAAGVATGDLEKGIGMAAGGAVGGYAVGSKLGGKASGAVAGSVSNAVNTFKSGAYSAEELQKQRQAKFDKEFKRNDENYNFLTKKGGMSSKEAQEFLNGDAQLFLDAGITDINLMYNAHKLAEEKHYDKQSMVARAELSRTLSDDFKTNVSEQNNFRKSIMDKDKKISSAMAYDLQADMIKLKKKN